MPTATAQGSGSVDAPPRLVGFRITLTDGFHSVIDKRMSAVRGRFSGQVLPALSTVYRGGENKADRRCRPAVKIT